MNAPIDIIVPWVNPDDLNWRHDFFNHFPEGKKCDAQIGRFRDCNTLKYSLRSIDQNCEWCEHVFLILASPSQIPDWLNTKSPKLKIVYHKDYIPSEFLPTFNSDVIEMFYPLIDELSENFILINDDMFFSSKVNSEFFFRDNKPVCLPKKKTIGSGLNVEMFIKNLRNNLNVETSLFNFDNVNYTYWGEHLPLPYNKTFQLFVLSKIKDEIYKRCGAFRSDSDINHFLYYDIMCKTKNCIFDSKARGEFYFFNKRLKSINFNQPMLCINESGQIDQCDINRLSGLLERRFSRKSSFEN